MNHKRLSGAHFLAAAARKTLRLAAAALPLFILALHTNAGAQASQGSARPARAESPRKAEGAPERPHIPDVRVFDQHGRRLRFYTDLIKGRNVAVNFIFTTCGYVCPMQGAAFARLQSALGARAGKEVHLVSVSTDPAADTPRRLREWGKKFGTGPGWTLVTGGKDEMDELLRALTGDAARRGEHSPVVFVGNVERGVWVREYGLAEPERYLGVFDALARDPAAEPPASANGAPPPRRRDPARRRGGGRPRRTRPNRVDTGCRRPTSPPSCAAAQRPPRTEPFP